MKRLDLIIALKLLNKKSVQDIADDLGIVPEAVEKSISFLNKNGMIRHNNVMKSSLMDFIIYGLPYVWPASPEGIVKGRRAGISTDLFSFVRVPDLYVWKDPAGDEEGFGFKVLHRVLLDAKPDREFDILINCIDVLRLQNSRAREKKIARDEIERILRA